VRTVVGATLRDNVRAVFGAGVERELLPWAFRSGVVSGDGLVSNAGYRARKAVFIVFINGRLVECGPLRRAVDAAYAGVLPTGARPWVYVSLTMPPAVVDVNVHPTKKEVRFLGEADVAAAAAAAVGEVLQAAAASRTFVAAAVASPSGGEGVALPPAKGGTKGRRGAAAAATAAAANDSDNSDGSEDDGDAEWEGGDGGAAKPAAKRKRVGEGTAASAAAPARVAPNRLVRTDATNAAGALDAYFSASLGGGANGGGGGGKAPAPADGRGRRGGAGGVGGGGFGGGGVPWRPAGPPGPDGDGVLLPDAPPLDDVDVTDANAGVGNMGVSARSALAARVRRRRLRGDAAPPLLTSVRSLLDAVADGAHAGLSAALREHVFVGVASPTAAIIQHRTRLLLVDLPSLLTELVYQQLLVRFADTDAAVLAPPPPVGILLRAAWAHAAPAEPHPAAAASADDALTLLTERAPLLDEYFSLRLAPAAADEAPVEDGDGADGPLLLHTLPMPLEGLHLDPAAVPALLVRLATAIDWSAEGPCLDGIAREVAAAYGRSWVPAAALAEGVDDGDEVVGGDAAEGEAAAAPGGGGGGGAERGAKAREWILRHVVFESLRVGFEAPQAFASAGVVQEMTSLERLYRIFERC